MFGLVRSRCSQYQLHPVRKRLPISGILVHHISQKLLFSSSIDNSQEKEQKKKDDDENSNDCNTSILYQRDPNRDIMPRASFFVSSLNSIYWVWYVADFIPAVNASPIDDLHINNYYGLGGLGLSLFIQAAFTLYPNSLISKIAYKSSSPVSTLNNNNNNTPQQRQQQQQQQQGDEILVWKNTLPLVRPSSTPIRFPLGKITMDKASDNTHKILKELGGDMKKFQGHLSLKRDDDDDDDSSDNSSSSSMNIIYKMMTNWPLLVEIKEPSEVYDSQKMLEVLLSSSGRGLKSQVNESNRIDHRSTSTSNAKFSQRKKMKHQQKKQGRKKK
jgi:hypothetical protein